MEESKPKENNPQSVSEPKRKPASQAKKEQKVSQASPLPRMDLLKKKIDPEVLKEIPEEAAIFYKFIPLSREGDLLEVGLVNPGDLKANEALRFIARRRGWRTKLYSITEEDFKKAIKQYRSLRGEVEKALKRLRKELEAEGFKLGKREKKEELAKQIAIEAPVTKIVAIILKHAVEGQASDIHIEPIENKVRVRFRVDGILHTSLFLPLEIHPAVVSRIKILSNLKIDETRIPQDGRFRTVINKREIDFRVSSLPISGGEKIVLRVLDPLIGLKSFKQLGLRGHNLEVLEKGIKKPFGMILLTGPTGSGKTTTLYAILNVLNQEGVNIISLEDPVEYNIEGVNQSQIKPEIGYSFASGLRHILRQDPDVIMAGEIRDEETAELAIHAALTGHIVLSTLHTNNAIGVIPRLIDMGIDSFLLPPSLNLCIAQRLARRLCPDCKEEIKAPPRLAEIIEKELSQLAQKNKKAAETYHKPFKVYRSKGCPLCGYKGTKGRIALFEIFAMTPETERIINEDVSEAKLKEEAQRQRMITMREDGLLKVLEGIISFEEMLRIVSGE